jgi:hypothetical protein
VARILSVKDDDAKAKINDAVAKVKGIFAGAEVVSVKPLEDIDDEIPF